ncbi:HET-domain-containing protein [Xylariaceae sp. FL1019]|nr:HET-domain-containing protein [Xylariaceae sp. FL1019]
MTLCSICNSFKRGHQAQGDQSPEPSFDFLNHHVSWPRFVLSAGSCHCCDILLRGICGCLKQQNLDTNQVESLGFKFRHFDRRRKCCHRDIKCRMTDGAKVYIEMFRPPDIDCPCPASWDDIPTSRRTGVGTDSKEAMETAMEWIRACDLDDHGGNRAHDVPAGRNYCLVRRQQRWPLPTRVVDVGRKDNVIKLVDGAGQLQPYLCLSHCWGTMPLITTTKATLDQRRREIKFGDLPRTFQDAIEMTRRLGLDYIWMDSLCILQDDISDWERESAQMGNTYNRAYLTLAATKSRNGSEGLLARTPDFVVSGKTPMGEDYYLVFRPSIDHDPHYKLDDRAAQYPLVTRAWALQERLLSLRMLHFGPHELWFQCATTHCCQCGLMGKAGSGMSMDEIYATCLEPISTTGGKQIRARVTHMRSGKFWRLLVANYTSLNLTFTNDRLPALGGLARRFAAIRGTRYLAGILEDTLIDDLLWYAHGRLKPRLAGCGAPSWSWASVDAKVSYSRSVLTMALPVEYAANRTAYSCVNKCVCLPAGLDEYGRIESGHLELTGPLLPVDFLLEKNHYVLRFSDIELPTPRFLPDYYLEQEGPQQVLPGSKVHCLRILREASTTADMSLVLRAVTNTDNRLFERIGLLQLMPRPNGLPEDRLTADARLLVLKGLDKAVIETITIV